MAEGMFNAWAPAGWAARSAGTDPVRQVRPEAIAVLSELGIDIRHHVPKALQDATGPAPRLVVGLCAEEACPVVPGTESLHWPLANPAGGGLDVFRRTRDDLAERVRSLIRSLPSVEP
jgi:arsenate reductase